MRWTSYIICTFVLAVFVFSALPAEAEVDAGVVLWRHSTSLEATRAVNFDGSNITAEARAHDWEINGSGIGVRLNYGFSRLVTLSGTLGMSQVTVRDEDLSAPDLDVDSRGFDDDLFVGAGIRLSSEFPGATEIFWSAGFSFSTFSADFNENVDRSWDYDETTFMLEGTAGRTVHGAELYGGLRLAWVDADLDEINRANPSGFQLRTTELERDGQLDILLGARTGSEPVAGFFELGLLGTFSASTGVALQF